MMESAIKKQLESPIHQLNETAISISDLSVTFGKNPALKNISLQFQKNKVNCIIGPSGSGKSTLLRSLNRINEDVSDQKISGEINFDGKNILNKTQDLTQLRKDIGMVFQSPCVFPKSIADNVVFGVEQHKKLSKLEKSRITEETLKAVTLWPEVSSRLSDMGTSLSIGQQQRLCIARTLAVRPKILLMDEPTSSLDPLSTRAIESLMKELKKEYTIILVTHNIAQAKRVADHVFFICKGELIEEGDSDQIFLHPINDNTKSFLENETCHC